jgi:hypothetical protein
MAREFRFLNQDARRNAERTDFGMADVSKQITRIRKVTETMSFVVRVDMCDLEEPSSQFGGKPFSSLRARSRASFSARTCDRELSMVTVASPRQTTLSVLGSEIKKRAAIFVFSLRYPVPPSHRELVSSGW